jgi:hypothetical protein
MIQRPNAVGLFLCQQAVVEERTRNSSLVNRFRQLSCASFPSPPRDFVVCALLTDGLGDMLLSLNLSRLDTFEEIYN